MNDDRENRRYDDIIGLPHPTSAAHPRMSMTARAAQFSPFAALTGYDAAIRETARLTLERIELDEDSKAWLDAKQQLLLCRIGEHPEVTVTYFVPDEKKSGGAYVTVTGNVKRIDTCARSMVMTDGTAIGLDDILEMESELFLYLKDGRGVGQDRE